MSSVTPIVFLIIVVVYSQENADDENMPKANLSKPVKLTSPSINSQPEQVHLSLGEEPGTVVAIWLTKTWTESVSRYGLHPDVCDKNVTGQTWSYGHGYSRHVHTVTFKNLQPSSCYFYYVGSQSGGWSDLFWFKTFPGPQDDGWSPKIALYGDMGSVNAASLPYLQRETHSGHLDAVIHVGDFAYDLYDQNGEVGDDFMRLIEPVAAYVPYMTTPGNHEHPQNYEEYRNRFPMPISPEVKEKGELHYSFNIGCVHFVSLNIEVYYKNGGTLQNVSSMYNWLDKDLNMQKQPWVVVVGHRPMYCGDGWWDCAQNLTLSRAGIMVDGKLKYGLEALLKKHKVDVAIWAHKHLYERLWPLYNFNVYKPNQKQVDPYNHPKATVHITTGSAGSSEGHPLPSAHNPEFIAANFFDYGFTRLTAHNFTHLQLEQISVDQAGKVIDNVMIVKSKRKPWRFSRRKARRHK